MSSRLLSHSYSEDQLRQLRSELYDSAISAGLVHPKDNLVRYLKRAVQGRIQGGCLGVQTPPSGSRSLITSIMLQHCGRAGATQSRV